MSSISNTNQKDSVKKPIKSKRLLLDSILIKYKDEIFKEFTPEITVYMSPAPAKNITETEDFIRSSIKKIKDGSNLQKVVLDKKTKEFLGCAGLHHIDTKTPELGIWIKKSAHGHGYGKEAMTALKEWADENIDYQYIIYPAVDKNYASRRIPESMGGKIFREYDEVNMSGVKHHLMEYRIYPNKQL